MEVPTIVSESSLRTLVEQNEDIPVPRRGGLQGSRHGQGSTASSSHTRDAADEPGEGFFCTFPQVKKMCEVGSALGVGTACGFYFMDAGGL